MYETVNYEQRDGTAIIALNRPDSLNGFTKQLCDDLLLAFETAHNDDSVRVVVLTGEGRAFSAGADLNKGLSGDRTLHGTLQYERIPAMNCVPQVLRLWFTRVIVKVVKFSCRVLCPLVPFIACIESRLT